MKDPKESEKSYQDFMKKEKKLISKLHKNICKDAREATSSLIIQNKKLQDLLEKLNKDTPGEK